MKIRGSYSIGIRFILILGFISLCSFGTLFASQLTLDKKVFAPGENITLHFEVTQQVAQNAWIGIIPSHVAHGSEAENDKYDLTYQYLKGLTSGVLSFKAPTQLGSYDFRMNDSDNNGKEIASVSFQVGKPVASLSLEKKNFSEGEEIRVIFIAGENFSNNAWIGIIPSNIAHGSEAENDKNDLSYQYLKGSQSGVLIFKAPTKPGSYDFRMHDTDSSGKEVASITFTVGSVNGSLSIEKNTYRPGENIQVQFVAGQGFANNAWIGIIPSNISHGIESENDRNDITYQYLQGAKSGVLVFKAPATPGTYDFRMHDTDNDGKEMAYVTFKVQ